MHTTTSADGTTIAFDSIGEGPALILIDGAMCYRNAGPMGPLADLLRTDFTVYTYDRRGRGDSGDTLPYSVAREVEDLEALITEAGGSAFVGTMSSGGALALTAAAGGAAISRLALYEPPFTSQPGQTAAKEEYTRQLHERLSRGERGDAVALFMALVGMPAPVIAGMRAAPSWSAFEAIAPTLAYDDAVLGDGTVPREHAAKVAVPTLLIDGGASPEVLRQAAAATAEALPHGRYETLEGQTHDVAPDALAPVLVRFFLKD